MRTCFALMGYQPAVEALDGSWPELNEGDFFSTEAFLESTTQSIMFSWHLDVIQQHSSE